MRHPYFALPPPLVIGHRGCAGLAPENTAVSFARGVREGAVILESDVHLSRDGVPVLVHDDRVDRVSDGTGAVRELRLEELRQLDFGYRFSPDGGESFPFRGQGIGVATLEEILEAHPGLRLNLELKDPVPGIVERTLDVIRRAGREQLTLLTAEKDELMAELRAVLAQTGAGVAQGASVGDVVAFLKAAGEGVAPPDGPMALQIPADFSGQPLVTPELVEHAHRHDIQVHVWTVNEVEEMQRLLDLGVDGLISDFPGRVAEVVARRSEG